MITKKQQIYLDKMNMLQNQIKNSILNVSKFTKFPE